MRKPSSAYNKRPKCLLLPRKEPVSRQSQMVTSELRWPQQRLLEEKHLTDYVSGTLAVQREHSVQCVCLSGCPEINDIWSRYLERWFNSEFDGPGHMRKMLLSCQCDFERGLSIVCDHLQLSTDKVDYAESCSYGQRVTTDSMLSGLHMNGDRRIWRPSVFRGS